MSLLRETAAELFVMAAIGLVLGLLGPFGSYALPLGLRVPGWIALAVSGYAFFRPVIAAGVALHERTAVPRPAAIALACAIAAIPTTLAFALLFAAFRIERLSADGIAARYPAVLLIGVIATGVQLALFAPRAAAATPLPVATALPDAPPTDPAVPAPPPPPAPDPPSAGPRPGFLDRLPPAQRDRLLCLEMEDHYVRAHAAGGSTLVLMRMRDAVAELDGIEGLRVHRSWWVARAAVADVVRRDRALLLRLVNGLEVPVARNEAPVLRAAGWL